MANGHGGARANSGPKKAETQEYRGTIRALFEQRGTVEQWEKVIDVAFARAASGDDAARKWVSDWCIGKVPDETNLNLPGGMLLYMPTRGPIRKTAPDADRDS